MRFDYVAGDYVSGLFSVFHNFAVFSKDSMGHVYDAEMQNQNHRKISDHELSKRSRFYQGSLDLDHMNKGNHFKTLPDSTIMFICTFDPYELGLCQYTFTERCHEADLELGDGTTKIFFNATMISPKRWQSCTDI